MKEPNIELCSRSRVTELVSSPDHSRVAAVRFEQDQGEPQTLAADLVVDASGRGAPTLSFLEKTGSPKPNQGEIEINIEYATSIFEIPRDPPAEWMGAGLFPIPPHMRRGGLLLPMEGGRWIVSLSGRHGDPPPGDLEGFIAFARTLRKPTIYEAIKTAKPLGDIVRYNFPASAEYLAGTQQCLEAPWATAISDFVYPQTRGERPADFEKRLQYGAALARLAA
jgi:hypothetical protein